jgi:hypothetical protein
MSLAHHKFKVPCFYVGRPMDSWCHVLRNCVTAAPKLAGALKPFVACRDLTIVIPLCAWERNREIAINEQATDRDASAVLG